MNTTTSDNTTVSAGAGLHLYQTTRGQGKNSVILIVTAMPTAGLNVQKPPVSAAGNFSEPRLTSKFGGVRDVVCARVSAVITVEAPVFVSLCSSRNHVTEVGGP